MTDTTIRIRVQAVGGKFLADDIGGAQITVRDVATGQVLATGRTHGTSSGAFPTPPSQWQLGASPSVIVNAALDPPTLYWVVADETTSHFDAVLSINQPTLVEITAYGPNCGLQSAAPATVRQWVIPGQNITPPSGLVVLLPGLIVQVMNPPTHYSPKPGDTVLFEANVTMMCGCPIAHSGQLPTLPNPAPWTPENFEVSALIRRLDVPNGQVSESIVPMCYKEHPSPSAPSTPSRFEGTCNMPTDGGYYEATIIAMQPATGNIGTGTVSFFANP